MTDPNGKSEDNVVTIAQSLRPTLPSGLVPTPTRVYNEGFARRQALRQPIRPALPLVRSTDAELGIRKVLLRGPIQPGPRNGRIRLQGVASVVPNTMNDFIQTPDTEGFDAVHTFAVVHQALVMCQRALGSPIGWQWDSPNEVKPINVFPRAGETMNAFYSRTD